MRNGDPNRNQTTWTNTDTRASPRAFYEPTHNQEISIRELGAVGALSDFMGGLGNMGFKTRRRAKDDITGSKSLIIGHRIERNSADNPKISGSLAGRIAKTLIYGKSEKYDTDFKNWRNKESSKRFRKAREHGELVRKAI